MSREFSSVKCLKLQSASFFKQNILLHGQLGCRSNNYDKLDRKYGNSRHPAQIMTPSCRPSCGKINVRSCVFITNVSVLEKICRSSSKTGGKCDEGCDERSVRQTGLWISPFNLVITLADRAHVGPGRPAAT
jgi:hypothetical protein